MNINLQNIIQNDYLTCFQGGIYPLNRVGHTYILQAVCQFLSAIAVAYQDCYGSYLARHVKICVAYIDIILKVILTAGQALAITATCMFRRKT